MDVAALLGPVIVFKAGFVAALRLVAESTQYRLLFTTMGMMLLEWGVFVLVVWFFGRQFVRQRRSDALALAGVAFLIHVGSFYLSAYAVILLLAVLVAP